MTRKVCVVITARPSYARIKTVLLAISENPKLELQVVVAASALIERYGSVVEVIKNDGFRVNSIVHMLVEGENLVTSAKSTGLGIIELATVFSQLQPDVIISVADRYETIATAIASAYMNIPLAHIQGGEVTGSIDEKVRHAVTKLADIHFVSNEKARDRVFKMGERADRIFVTGCPSVDLAKQTLIENSSVDNLLNKYNGVGHKFDLDRDFIVVMQHPVTTQYLSGAEQIRETLEAIKLINMPTLLFWPNVDAGSDGISKCIRHFRESENVRFIYFLKNVSPEDFLRVLRQCRVLVGNSSVGIRESGFLGVPVVNIGDRQRGRDRSANVFDVGYRSSEIVTAIRAQISKGYYEQDTLYGDGAAGVRIAQILEDVTLDVNKMITY